MNHGRSASNPQRTNHSSYCPQTQYGIKQGMKMTVQESGSGIVLQVVPRIEDLVGIDAGKIDIKKAIEMLDKMRSEDRY